METENRYVYKEQKPRLASRIFWGLIFLAAGAAIVLNQLGVFPFMDLSLGNMIWTVVLVIILIKSLANKFWFGVFLSAAFLIMIFGDIIGLPTDLRWWPIFGAAVFLSIGFTILFRPKKRKWYYFGGSYDYDDACAERDRVNNGRRVDAEFIYDDSNTCQNSEGETYQNSNNTGDNTNSTSSSSDNESEIYAKASFGSTIKYVNSKSFKRALLNCNFGSMKVYFDNAEIIGGEATIAIDGSFCGIELFIPSNWVVIDEIDHVLSGMDEKNPRRGNSSNGPIVRITGNIKFSGIEIIYI